MTQTKISRKWMLAVTALLSMMILMLAAMQTNAAPATTAPAAPTNIAQTSAFGSYAKIKWDAVKGTGVKYQIEVSQDKVKWVPLATVGNTYYTVSKMETGAIYYFRIKTVVGTLSSPYTEPFQVITQPGYISEVKQTASKANQVTVSWTAAAGAGAYDVYIGTTEENVKYNQTVKAKTTATIKKLKKDKTYIVKIVPFNISRADIGQTVLREPTHPSAHFRARFPVFHLFRGLTEARTLPWSGKRRKMQTAIR
ncbi:MAG: fibronectin type III domain-containing protein [Lachnospiraceae bacterium]|nr:fibronectin type III domain-containing protein [Lachnospiraceae bacterium]